MRLTRPAAAPSAVPEGVRICAVGDIHGEAGRLLSLLGLIARRGHWKMVFLGDYIDRGPNSAAVLEIVRSQPEAVCLLGNHEAMLLAALDDPQSALVWLANGGTETLASFGIAPDTPPASWRLLLPPWVERWLRARPLSFAAGDYLFVHAGVRPGVPLAEQTPHDLLWIREPFLSHPGSLPARVVHGHTVVSAPQVRPHRIGIDTGAVFEGGTLTAVLLEGAGMEFLSA